MPINPLISLMGKPVELARSVRQGAVARNVIDTNVENQQTRETRQKAGSLAVQQKQIEVDNAADQAKLDRALQDTLKVKPMLESGNIEGALGVMKARREAILERGGDTRETDGLMAMLASGDVEGTLADLDEGLAHFKAIGMIAPKQQGGFTLSPGQSRFDDQGNVIAQGGEAPVDNTGPEANLRKEFVGLSKDFTKQNASFGRIQASANDPSPAGDMALMFNFMKLLDPGSTVREGEFAQVAATGAFGDKIGALVSNVVNGRRLTDAQRADFFDRSQTLFSEATQQHNQLKTQFSELATRNSFNPDNVAIDLLAADPDREVNLTGTRERTTLAGVNYVKINGQWFEE